MNQRIKKLWIKALRGGDFVQGFGQLRRGRKDPQHCCLGVLEELAKQEGVIKSFRGADGYLSDTVKEWAGLDRRNPRAGRRALTTLAGLNDHGKDFRYIADRIEKYL